MKLITRDDASYDETRAVFNAMIDRYPAVIARCATPDGVASALELARRERLDVAVRAGGHSVAGLSVNDGRMVIDVRPMKQITVDPVARTVKGPANYQRLARIKANYDPAMSSAAIRTSSQHRDRSLLWQDRNARLDCYLVPRSAPRPGPTLGDRHDHDNGWRHDRRTAYPL